MSAPRRPDLRRWPAACGLAALLLLAAAPARALDFHLHSSSVEEDGFTHEEWSFQNDPQSRVTISLPAGWNHEDETASLTLTPQTITNGMVKIEKSSIAPSVPFKDAGLEVYRKKMLADVPQGATGVRLTGETVNPLPIFHWFSHEFVAEYDFFGQSYQRSVLFLDLNAKEQLVVTAVAPKKDFDRVYAAGMDVLRSWQIMPVH